MRSEKLLEALGEVRDAFIEDADAAPAARAKKKPWLKWSALAACLCLIAAGVFTIPRILARPGVESLGDGTGTNAETGTGTGKTAEIDAQAWTDTMTAKDYFRNSGKKGSGASEMIAADLVMGPSAVMCSLGEERETFEEDGVVPKMPEHTEHSFSAAYNGDASLYKVTFYWMRRGKSDDRTVDYYSDLKFTASPKELHELSCIVYTPTDENGNVIPPYVTVTQRDGVLIYAEGRENEQKTMTWKTDVGWFEVFGSWNDSYEDVVALFEWFWAHPLDLTLFEEPPEGTMIRSTRAEHPDAFSDAIPDFAALGYEALTELVNLGQYGIGGELIPVWFEGVYTRSDTVVRWSLSTGADGDAWAACLGRPREVTEEKLTEALADKNWVNLFSDWSVDGPALMATVWLESGEVADLWEIVQSMVK
ncbi:MAG: hypothetical protein IKQ92_06340 [Clostridia bacterium]|nr:hypothetical protein [Clostridia bacterium]